MAWWMRVIRSNGGRAMRADDGRGFFTQRAGSLRSWPLAPACTLAKFGQQLLVGLVLFQSRDQGFHRFDRVQIDHHAAQFADGFDLVLWKKFFFLAGAA